MGPVNINCMLRACNRYLKAQQPKTAAYSYATVLANVEKAVKTAEGQPVRKNGIDAGSKVAEYQRNHPEAASCVEDQVNAGRKYLSGKGADSVARDTMTMEEYKSFITGLLEEVPYDSTRLHDGEMTSITEEGWEQMKKDPDYEAWVFGYTVQNRAARNPFALWTGSMFAIEKFGASIEEHRGESIPINDAKGKDPNEKSWWQKRHERFKELGEKQEELAMTKHQIQRERILAKMEGREEKSIAMQAESLMELLMPKEGEGKV